MSGETPEAPPLTAQLEAALVRELAGVWAWENAVRFKGAMTAPVIVLDDVATRLGSWRHATRQLAMSRKLVVERPWHDVVAVLEHEMAHQYVDEVLKVAGESPHGDTFQRVCKERGIDANAGGDIIASDANV